MKEITWKKILNEVKQLNECDIWCEVLRVKDQFMVRVKRQDGEVKTYHPANMETTWLFLQGLWK